MTSSVLCSIDPVSGFQFATKFRHANHGDFDLIQSGRKAAADMAFPTASKGGARHHCDFLFMKQAEREIATGESGGGDFWEHVECTARARAFQAHVSKGTDNEISAHLVFAPHATHALLASIEGFDGGILAHDRSAQDRVLMNFHHGLDQFSGSAGESNPPTGHRKSF